MKKNISWLLAAASMVVTLASCTKDSDSDSTTPSLNLVVSEITARGAVVSASISTYEDASPLYVVLQKDGSYVESHQLTPDSTQKVSYLFYNLEPGGSYSCFLMSNNKAVSNDAAFTTLDYDQGVTALPATEIKINSAVISARVSRQNPNRPLFKYRKVGNDWSRNFLYEKWVESGDSAVMSINLDGLDANTKYEYCLTWSKDYRYYVSNVCTFQTYAVSDYDGNLYHLITIGNQTWLQEDLRCYHFANGERMSHVWGNSWPVFASACLFCHYNHEDDLADPDLSNPSPSSCLYNFATVSYSQEHPFIAGMHVPTLEEWQTLATSLDGSIGPESPFKGEYGGEVGTTGNCQGLGSYGRYWSSIQNDQTGVCGYAGFDSQRKFFIDYEDKVYGNHIRLIKDE